MNPLLPTRRVALFCAAAAANGGCRRSSSSAASTPWLYSPGNPLLPWPPLSPSPSSNPPPSTKVDTAVISSSLPAETSGDLSTVEVFSEKDVAAITRVLTRPFSESGELEAALNGTGLEPSSPLLEAVLRSSDLSAIAALSLFRWFRNRCPNLLPSPPLLASIVDILGKARSFSTAWNVLLCNSRREDSYAALIRRYARAGMASAAIRTFEYASDSDACQLFDVLIDALCKEGHARAGEDYINRRKMAQPGWFPSIRCYNILLNGWFRSRRFRKVQKLWEEIRREEKIRPTVITYGTMIEGLCRLRRADQAMELLEEMRSAGIRPNEITCNPIVDALAEAGRFKDALAAVERFPLYGIAPNISTYNSLVKGFCKNGDLVGASKILKTMIGRGILPTVTTYNYFFRFFARTGKIEEGMNLYEKIVQSGYSPDRLTYHLIVKMLCEGKRLGLAAQVIREMHDNGLDSDLATSSMLVHLLCRTHQFDEACEEFQRMIKKGIVPQYLTYRVLVKELKRLGRMEMVAKLSGLMSSLPHSTKLPNTYMDAADGEHSLELKKKNSILRKAQAMSDALKHSKDRPASTGGAGSSEDAVAAAKSLISDIKRRVFAD